MFFQYPGLTTAQQLAPDNEQDVWQQINRLTFTFLSPYLARWWLPETQGQAWALLSYLLFKKHRKNWTTFFSAVTKFTYK